MTQQQINVILSLTTAGALVKLNSFITQAATQLRTLALNTVGAYAGIAGIMKFDTALRGAVDLQVQVGRISEKTGASVAMIELLRESADKVNVPFERVNTALGLFSKNVFDAANGNAKLSGEFQRLGISLTLDGKLRSTNDVLVQFISKLQSMSAGEAKAYAASSELGRSGRELIPVFNAAGDAINHIRDSGGPITEESVAQATEFDQKLRELHMTLGLIMVRVVNELLPALTNLVTRMDAVAASAETSKETVNGLVDFLKGLLTVTLAVGLGFKNLGEIIGVSAATDYANYQTAADGLVKIINSLLVSLHDEIQLVIDLTESIYNLGKAAGDIALGDFSGAKDIIKGQVADIKDDLKNIMSDVADNAQTEWDTVLDVFLKSMGEIHVQSKSLLGSLTGEWSGLAKFIDNLWNPKSPDPKNKPTKNEIGPDVGPNPQSLKNFKTLIALSETYFKQQMKLIESDPFSTKSMKSAAELPLINAQVKSLGAQLETSKLNEKQAKTDTDRLTAQTESAKIQGQINDLLIERQKLQGQSSLGYNVGADFTKIQDQLGTFQEQAGKFLTSPFEGLDKGIESSFDKMMTKGGSFKQFMQGVGVSMYQSFAQSLSKMVADFVTSSAMMAVRWMAGELGMTAATTAGGSARNASRLSETIFHLAQVAFRIASHVAGEIASTVVTIAQSAIRVGVILAETFAYVIKAAVEAMAAMADIPYVGPVLAVAAAAAIIAAGVGLMSRDSGGPGEAGRAYAIGTGAQPEIFVPHSAGTFYPRSQVATMAGGSNSKGANVEGHKVNVHIYGVPPHPRDFLASSEGENMIVNIAAKRKTDIGIPS